MWETTSDLTRTLLAQCDQFWLRFALIKTGGTSFRDNAGQSNPAGRDIIRETTLGVISGRRAPTTMGENEAALERFYHSRKPLLRYAWGMGIDPEQSSVAYGLHCPCQAENNIPVVGKTRCVVAAGRCIWIRIDTYFRGNTAIPDITHQASCQCMHCENAPCELFVRRSYRATTVKG